jgi:hypothetical protein
VPTEVTAIRARLNLAYLMLRYAMGIESGERSSNQIIKGRPRQLQRRVMQPMVPALFFATLLTCSVGAGVILISGAVHLPGIAEAVIAYPLLFAPTVIFLLVDAFFWVKRIRRPETELRIKISASNPLLIQATIAAAAAAAAAGAIVDFAHGAPF